MNINLKEVFHWLIRHFVHIFLKLIFHSRLLCLKALNTEAEFALQTALKLSFEGELHLSILVECILDAWGADVVV